MRAGENPPQTGQTAHTKPGVGHHRFFRAWWPHRSSADNIIALKIPQIGYNDLPDPGCCPTGNGARHINIHPDRHGRWAGRQCDTSMVHGMATRVTGWSEIWICLVLCLFCFGLRSSPLWAQDTPPSPNAVISVSAAPNDPARVVVGTLNVPEPAGIYYSEDGGVSWQQATGVPANTSISALEHDAVNPAIVYAGDATTGHFLRSLNGGRTFTEEPGFLSWLSNDSGIGVLYSQDINGFSVLYAGTRQDGVLVSYDNGESWVINAIGLPLPGNLSQSSRRIRTIAEFSGAFYIGTHNGVFVQADGTDVWQRMPDFAEGTLVRSLWVYRNNLYAGLVGDGLWRLDRNNVWTRAAGYPVEASVFTMRHAGALLVTGTGLGLWSGNGDNWLKVRANEQVYSEQIWAMDGVQGVLYAGTDDDWVMRSDDQGFAFRSFGTYAPLAAQPLPAIRLQSAAPPTPVPPPAEETPDLPTPVSTPASEPAEEPATADPTATPTPDSVSTPAATPVPTPTVPATAGLQTFIDNLNLPFDLAVGNVDIPYLGSFSPLVFAAAVLLIVIIVAGVISVFQRTGDDEE